MVGCSILGCKSRSERHRKVQEITFHSFPNDEEMRKKWVKITGRPNWHPTKNTKVCSIHFTDDAKYTKRGLVYLRPHAIPVKHIQPLNELAIDRPSYFMVDDICFSQPFQTKYTVSDNTHEEETKSNMFVFMEDIAVEKRMGRKNRYHLNIGSDPICPQQNCRKRFGSISRLKSHIRKTHCAELKYACDHCGAKFSAKYLLRRHMDVHEKRTVQCSVCHKHLSARSNMAVHLRSHTNSRTHICPLCSKGFVRKATLLKHIKFVHKLTVTDGTNERFQKFIEKHPQWNQRRDREQEGSDFVPIIDIKCEPVDENESEEMCLAARYDSHTLQKFTNTFSEWNQRRKDSKAQELAPVVDVKCEPVDEDMISDAEKRLNETMQVLIKQEKVDTEEEHIANVDISVTRVEEPVTHEDDPAGKVEVLLTQESEAQIDLAAEKEGAMKEDIEVPKNKEISNKQAEVLLETETSTKEGLRKQCPEEEGTEVLIKPEELGLCGDL